MKLAIHTAPDRMRSSPFTSRWRVQFVLMSLAEVGRWVSKGDAIIHRSPVVGGSFCFSVSVARAAASRLALPRICWLTLPAR